MNDSLTLMADIEARFRTASGLDHCRHYAIFYSRMQRSPLMVLGINPGGSPDDEGYSKEPPRFDLWQHDYVDCNYRIASVMRPALMDALGTTSPEDLRGIPKANLIFHRSSDIRGLDLRKLAHECAPFVAEIIDYVRPAVIICEGHAARDLLFRNLVADPDEVESAAIFGPYRGRPARFFTKHRGSLRASGRTLTVLTTGHPSSFGHLPDWAQVRAALREELGPNYLPSWGDARLE